MSNILLVSIDNSLYFREEYSQESISISVVAVPPNTGLAPWNLLSGYQYLYTTGPKCERAAGMPNYSPLDPLGNLGVCPPEIVFKILNDILWGSPELTHETFCVINKLRKTHKTLGQMVAYWMTGRRVRAYINDCVSNQWCINPSSSTTESMIWQLFVFKEPFGPDNDLITGIIRDDCVDCYNWLRQLLPGDEKFPDSLMACLNEHGWTFFSLAVHAGAHKILHNQTILPCSCKLHLGDVD